LTSLFEVPDEAKCAVDMRTVERNQPRGNDAACFLPRTTMRLRCQL
jgi:hypothetical protein